MAPLGSNNAAVRAVQQQKDTLNHHQSGQDIEVWLESPESAYESHITKEKRITGGLPPHLLHLRGKTNVSPPPDAARTTATSNSRSMSVARKQLGSSVAHQSMGSPTVHLPSCEENPQPRKTVIPIQEPASPRSAHVDEVPHVASKQRSPTFTCVSSKQWGPTRDLASTSMHPVIQKMKGKAFGFGIRSQCVGGLNSNGDRLPSGYDDWDNNQTIQSREYAQGTLAPGPIGKMKWRPKKSEDIGSQSLPSMATFTMSSGDDTNRFLESSQNGREETIAKEIRGSIADEVDIVPKADESRWVNKHVWKDYRSITPSDNENDSDDEEASSKKGWRSAYCDDWVTSLPSSPPPIAFCLDPEIKRHWECGIDPKDGFLMAPIEYPASRINLQDASTEGEHLQRRTSTAALRVELEFSKYKKRGCKVEKEERERSAYCLPPNSTPVKECPVLRSPLHSPTQLFSAVKQQLDKVSTNEELASWSQMDEREPNIRCHLRPVKKEDIPQIVEIYNWEVINGHQALDGKPLTRADIRRVFSLCKSDQTPFLVAVQGTSKESVVRREVPAPVCPYGPYQQQPLPDRHYRVPVHSTQSPPDKILGFGLISLPMSGLAGNVHTSVGRFIGRVHVYVENQSRRHGIGRAILHRLLRCCSVFVPSADWYEWYDPDNAKVFDEPDYNPRNYSCVYAEIAVQPDHPIPAGYTKLFEEMNFVFVSTLHKARKVGFGRDGSWFDTLAWQHDCRVLHIVPESKRRTQYF